MIAITLFYRNKSTHVVFEVFYIQRARYFLRMTATFHGLTTAARCSTFTRGYGRLLENGKLYRCEVLQ